MNPLGRASTPAKPETLTTSTPKMKTGNLLDRMAQELEEVKAVVRKNEIMENNLSELRATNEQLGKMNAGWRNAKAMQQARIDGLEQENQELKAKAKEIEKYRDRLSALEQSRKDLKVEKANLSAKHKARISTLELEKADERNQNARLTEQNKSLSEGNKKLSESVGRLSDSNKALWEGNRKLSKQVQEMDMQKIARQQSALRHELDGKSKTLVGLEKQVETLQQEHHTEVAGLQIELANRADKIVMMEERATKMEGQLDAAANREDANAAACRKNAELKNAMAGLRNMLASERVQNRETTRDLNDVAAKLREVECEATTLHLAASRKEAVLVGERLSVQAWQCEQNQDLARLQHASQRLAYELANVRSELLSRQRECSVYRKQSAKYEQSLRAAEHDVTVARKERDHEREAAQKLQVNHSALSQEKCRLEKELEDLAGARDELWEEVVELRPAVGIASREKEVLFYELQDVTSERNELQDQRDKFQCEASRMSQAISEREDKLHSLRSSTNIHPDPSEALRDVKGRLRAAEAAKAKYAETVKRLVSRAGTGELVTPSHKRDRERRKSICQRPTRYIGTDDVEGSLEAHLRPSVYELYRSSTAVEVSFDGRVMPHGFRILPSDLALKTTSDVGGDGEVDGAGKGTMQDGETLRDTPWVLTSHGRSAKTIQKCKDDDDADEQVCADMDAASERLVKTVESGEHEPHEQGFPKTIQSRERQGRGATEPRGEAGKGPSQSSLAISATWPSENMHQRGPTPAAPTSQASPHSRPPTRPHINNHPPPAARTPQPEAVGASSSPSAPPPDRPDLSSHPAKRPRPDDLDDPRLRAPKHPRRFRQASWWGGTREAKARGGRAGGDRYRPLYS